MNLAFWNLTDNLYKILYSEQNNSFWYHLVILDDALFVCFESCVFAARHLRLGPKRDIGNKNEIR